MCVCVWVCEQCCMYVCTFFCLWNRKIVPKWNIQTCVKRLIACLKCFSLWLIFRFEFIWYFCFFKFQTYIIISRISLYSRHLCINSLCLFSVNIYGLRFVSRQVDITGNPLISYLIWKRSRIFYQSLFLYCIILSI